MWILITPSQRCSGILCTLRFDCYRGLIPTLYWLLGDAGQLLTPTLTVFLSGTCWLMGETKGCSDFSHEIVTYNRFLILKWISLPPNLPFSQMPLLWRPLPDNTGSCGSSIRTLISIPPQAFYFQDVHFCSYWRSQYWQGWGGISRGHDPSQGKGIECNYLGKMFWYYFIYRLIYILYNITLVFHKVYIHCDTAVCQPSLQNNCEPRCFRRSK